MRPRSLALALALVTFAAAAAVAQGQASPSGLLGRSTLDVALQAGDRAGGAFAALTPGAGEAHTVRSELVRPGAGRAAKRRSLLYFAQLTDFQLSDEESPARVEFLDSSADSPLNSPFGSAWRPQEAFVAHLTEMAVRQVNAFAGASPVAQGGGGRAALGFAITTGDSADSQQRNETEAVVRLLEGGTVVNNSGSANPADYAGSPSCLLVPEGVETTPRYTGVQDFDDGLAGGAFWDPDQPTGQFSAFPQWPGLMDRAQQPFDATGLTVPSYVTFGNHDGLVQGNQAANPGFESVARGCVKPFVPTPSAGPADTPDEAAALLASGGAKPVAPDPAREFVSKPEYKDLHAGGRDAHGFAFIDPAELRASRGAAGYYSWSPAPGFRFIGMDTVSDGGIAGPSANGNLDDPQFRWIRGELEEARAADQMVVLFGHHPPRSLNSPVPDEAAGSCSGSDPEGRDARAGCDLDPRDSRPVHDGDDLEALLKEFSNVVALVSGHTHENAVKPISRDDGRSGFWEIETAAELDFPNQNRLIEFMDNRDGTLSIFGTILDHAGDAAAPPAGPASGFSVEQLASIGRVVALNDPQSAMASDTGEVGGGGSGRALDRNVELLLPDPRRAGGGFVGGDQGTGGSGSRARIRLSVSPRTIRAGRRVRLRFRATARGRAVRAARIRMAGRRVTTNRRGRATMVVRFGRRGRRQAVATKAGLRRGTAAVRVLRRQGRRRAAPRFTG